MAVIPTPEQGKPILDFSAGTFDGNSNLFQSRNGATEHVNGDDVADYVNTSRIYNGLETASKTPIGAINEIKTQEESDLADVQGAIDEINSTAAPLFYTEVSTIQKTIPTHSMVAITVTDLDLHIPTGYSIVGIVQISNTRNTIAILSFNAEASMNVVKLYNLSSADETNTTTVKVLYIKSGFIKNVTPTS